MVDASRSVWGGLGGGWEVPGRAPGLQAKTLFEWLQREYPGKYQAGQLQPLQGDKSNFGGRVSDRKSAIWRTSASASASFAVIVKQSQLSHASSTVKLPSVKSQNIWSSPMTNSDNGFRLKWSATDLQTSGNEEESISALSCVRRSLASLKKCGSIFGDRKRGRS